MYDTQSTKIVKLLKRRPIKGATNWELSQISLKYSSRIAELRQDGVNIIAVRQFLPNGRATNTWRYFINDEE